MAERHKKLKTMPECMRHMTTEMGMERDAARTRCESLVKKNNNKKSSGSRSNSSY